MFLAQALFFMSCINTKTIDLELQLRKNLLFWAGARTTKLQENEIYKATGRMLKVHYVNSPVVNRTYQVKSPLIYQSY